MFPRSSALNACAFLLTSAVSGICWFFSCLANESKYSIAFGAGIPVVLFLMNVFSGVSERLGWMGRVSDYGLFEANNILSGSFDFLPVCSVYVFGAAALYAAGFLFSARKICRYKEFKKNTRDSGEVPACLLLTCHGLLPWTIARHSLAQALHSFGRTLTQWSSWNMAQLRRIARGVVRPTRRGADILGEFGVPGHRAQPARLQTLAHSNQGADTGDPGRVYVRFRPGTPRSIRRTPCAATLAGVDALLIFVCLICYDSHCSSPLKN
jgi:hypothetical protein